jgi:PAS domain S-box-containing protein
LRKEAEEALRESEERFRATFEQAVVGIAHVNLEGQFLRLNQKFCEIAGYTPEEMLSLTYQEITHPDDLDVDLKYARQLLAGEIQTYSMEKRYIRKDSSQVWVNLTLSLVRSPSNEPKYFIAVVQDISDSLHDSCASGKQAQEILQRSQAQLRDKANQLEQALHELRHTQAQLVQSEKMYSLGLLVAGVAHEINNPVNFICGNLVHLQGYFKDLLELMQLYQVHLPNPVPEIQAAIQDKELDFLVEDIPSIMSSMKVGTDRIRDIVFSLKSFSRTDEAEMKPVDIHEGIDTTLMILDHSLKVKAGRSAIKLIKNYGNLPLVECYPGQLNQVFMNLIKNAIDALDEYMPQQSLDGSQTKEGKIEIRTETLDSGRVAICIVDNGPGISPEVQQRLFDPFFTTKVLGKGTGLGLTISQQIVVDKHQGQLRCFSTPGEGTEFAIELPIRQPKLQQ